MITTNNATLNEARTYTNSIRNELRAVWAGEALTEDGEPADLYDYLSDAALDVEYTLDSARNLIGVSIWLTVGGPSCWIDTRRKEVVTAWGSERASLPLDDDICNAITELYADI